MKILIEVPLMTKDELNDLKSDIKKLVKSHTGVTPKVKLLTRPKIGL
jgi:hypothetical protein